MCICIMKFYSWMKYLWVHKGAGVSGGCQLCHVVVGRRLLSFATLSLTAKPNFQSQGYLGVKRELAYWEKSSLNGSEGERTDHIHSVKIMVFIMSGISDRKHRQAALSFSFFPLSSCFFLFNR